MKNSALAVLLLVFGYGQSLAQAGDNAKPNILLFMVDDMGWQDTSVPFFNETTPLNRRYHTPNMERLAKKGMKFTNAYATPLCSPTRVSLLTGMNAARHRVTNWTHMVRDNSTDAKDDVFEPVSWNLNGFSPVEGIPGTVYGTPLPQLLKEAGYYTIHVGKAHWGSMGTPGANPTNLGFLVNIAGHAAGHPQSYQGSQNYGSMPGKTTYHAVPGLQEYYGSEVFLSEALTLEAMKALEQPVKEKKPFFLYMAHYAVHTPIQADARYYGKYLEAGLDSIEARYASLVEGMDKSLGDLLDYLERNDLEKNTVVIFMSDNGGLSLVPPRGGQLHTHNLPLKAGKGSMHEGGIREPMLVSWPGVTKAGSTCGQYVVIEDFFPTLLEIGSATGRKPLQSVDGSSFVRYLRKPERRDESRSLVWHFPNKWTGGGGPGINYSSAIRKGSWKLIYSMKDQKLSLYNLADDIGEERDLAGTNTAKRDELARELTAKLKGWNAQMPVYRSTGAAAKWPDEISSR
ncbi:MAG: sulfatase [Cytophagaceae bacterium SCN 52-12]|nr:MAG: sulfatase [Cytophagaceae bacterium SCN 52-12]